MKEFRPHLEILPPAQARLWHELSGVPGQFVLYGGTALAAAHALYGPTFNPEVTLKALSYFDDGNLRDLPDDLRLRMVNAAREVDLDHLPVVGADFQRTNADHGLE
jgi:hypothetical protein